MAIVERGYGRTIERVGAAARAQTSPDFLRRSWNALRSCKHAFQPNQQIIETILRFARVERCYLNKIVTCQVMTRPKYSVGNNADITCASVSSASFNITSKLLNCFGLCSVRRDVALDFNSSGSKLDVDASTITYLCFEVYNAKVVII